MYDEIICDYEIPVGTGHTFQTKSLIRHLNIYSIEDTGRLLQHTETKDGSWDVLHLDAPRHLINFTGEIIFYMGIDMPDGTEEDAEYSAYFVQGNLKHIERL